MDPLTTRRRRRRYGVLLTGLAIVDALAGVSLRSLPETAPILTFSIIWGICTGLICIGAFILALSSSHK